MMTAPLRLSSKQAEVIAAANDPSVDTIVLLGAVGTGKSDVAAHLVLSICHQFPKTRWPVFRVNQSTAVETIIPSFLDMADRMGLRQGIDYLFTQKPYRITFSNGSTVPFREADATKDRGGKKIKGINATGNLLDEVDEFDCEMYLQATSRRGRHNEAGQPSLSILTLNPNDGWVKDELYDPWKAGTLPAGTVVIEFGLEDSWQSSRDVARLKTNPPWWTERYLYNNWSYADESTSLFKSRHWATSIVDELPAGETRFAGYDVARSGNDRSVRALTYGKVIADIRITKGENDQVDTSVQADILVDDAGEFGYGLDNLSVDAVGLGVGVIDALTKLGYHPTEYMSGAKPDPAIRLAAQDNTTLSFDSLRSQMVYLYAQGVERGIIKHFRGTPHLKELQKEAMSHHYEITDKTFKVESKDKVKKRLGKSPDLFDAVLMALFLALRPVNTFPSQGATRGSGGSSFGAAGFGALRDRRF